MSIIAAFNNAFSGMSAGSKLAEIASGNIANALTEGYARREAALSSRNLGGNGMGVTVVSVRRQIDEGLLQDLRLSQAKGSANQARLDFYSQIESLYGNPTDAQSLAGSVAGLERALIEAAARPESVARLSLVADSANQLVTGLNDAADKIAALRQNADRAIARDVETLNSALSNARDLNMKIRNLQARGQDVSGLLDQRQQVIDQISQIVPVRALQRQNGEIALFTSTGATLLDGKAAVFGFEPTPMITPEMSRSAGDLSGLTINGQPLSTAPNGGRLGEGGLSSHFLLRDTWAPAAQAEIDTLARNLIERFASPSVDPTLAPAEAGLFIDQAGPFDPVNETGLAARLALNSSVDPARGGQLWRLRDGINASTESGLADPSILNGYLTALQEKLPTSSGQNGNFAELIAQTAAGNSSHRLIAENDVAQQSSRTQALTSALLEGGVDTDKEMQDLMLIEQAYAANARVLQTIDQMLATILEI